MIEQSFQRNRYSTILQSKLALCKEQMNNRISINPNFNPYEHIN